MRDTRPPPAPLAPSEEVRGTFTKQGWCRHWFCGAQETLDPLLQVRTSWMPLILRPSWPGLSFTPNGLQHLHTHALSSRTVHSFTQHTNFWWYWGTWRGRTRHCCGGTSRPQQERGTEMRQMRCMWEEPGWREARVPQDSVGRMVRLPTVYRPMGVQNNREATYASIS